MRFESNNISKNILIGSLLGDLNLQYMGLNWRIRGIQHKNHEDWLKIVHSHLEPNPSRTLKYDNYNRVWFNTLTLKSFELNSIGFKFYPDATAFYVGRKHVPSDISTLLNHPAGLAAWFMDDGSKRSVNGYILCTDCFSKPEVERLRDTLSTNFSITDTSINYKDNKPRLRIKTGSALHFKEIIEPHIVPSFKYKL